MKHRFFLTALFSILFFLNTKAQDYTAGVGLRFGGYENGLTGKYFVDENTAYEGILGFRTGVFVLTGLYEKHAPLLDVPDLKWYFGLGAHIGGINGERYRRYTGNDDKVYKSGLLLGADAVIGAEWLIPNAPLSLGADLHPRLELAKGPFLDLEPAITIRYIF
ncbi:hypothetical protein Pedsa_2550 [Pseudopedobacter saltans DSM 12145]|uniref:Secreted protein n=1 Tax=Pseudopedobacter saltans (strain ATCC 51119 / DSM 12145 / JCM 21818 / CCUG 39354 / LMG 10337 / NBRC 100064 / NCIMB 13643) TaxID=762903 RepID=F0S4S6_PSESL|nr:hypothetical protein [Pseudopedobacter saltans]ADY53094.1 hypothetical protein Pedsa_2550 [Pseudopedobacter saltans DSM 12145]